MRIVRACLFCLTVHAAFSSDVEASVNICSDPAIHSRLSIEIVNFGDSTIDQNAVAIDRDNTDYDLLFAVGDDRYLFGAGHRYRIFDIDDLPMATNGHLHTSFFPLHVLFGNDKQNFRVSAAAALSASSNLYNNLGEFDNDALRLLGALVWGRRLSEQVEVRYGICGDHRFGEYKVYPTARVLWQPHPDWHVELGFPNSKVQYRISDELSTDIRISPDGNEWYVLDRSLTINSMFVYESYLIEWALNWQFLDSFALTASVGQQLDNHYEMTFLDQSRVQLSSDPVTRIGAAIEWRF